MDFLKEYGLTNEDVENLEINLENDDINFICMHEEEIKEIIEYLISKGLNKYDIIELLIYKTELFYETKDKVKEIYETNDN